MLATLSVIARMGTLQRLAPFWLAGIAALIAVFHPRLLVALVWGAVLQFFVEYVMHRFLYHRPPPTRQSLFNRLYRDHIAHHELPTDPEFFTGGDNWFPLIFGAVAMGAHTLALWPFVGFEVAVLFAWVAVFVGSVTAFAFYEYCHTLAHLNVPKGRWGRKITADHLAHHFQDHNATYHVSAGMGWIDRLFGTDHDKVAARERFDRRTLMTLGMDPEDLRLVVARKAYGTETRLRGRRG